MANIINPDLFLTSVQQVQKQVEKDVLGKDDFMKILMTQLQNQDPLNPMEDKDFIAQMATFSTLEQITNLGKTMEQFLEAENQNKLISYNQFIGKEINWHKQKETSPNEPEGSTLEGTGVINSVRFKGNEVELILKDGTVLYPGNISQLKNSSSFNETNTLVNASNLIGKQISWNNGSKEESSIVTSVSKKEGILWLQLKNGEKIKEEDILKIS
ncbi:flagellar hook assembly protein FlgD [Rossellomorea vietnamensis]|uniref:Basal-body rod modification protein FlgD n=1 Tax=Rossellomorea vietnamensis TaxID=218284 RepID=A0A5D4NQU5_9BACI|nr:flagellar hook assembly protein FlgD [Rossellomorea vietnamensis]TYS16280.1 flagellar hook assembly protein FlgD [Rossellomorea vietnamensis]